jgi:uncharacterized protein YutE (UPF0331/DUF86 family)
MPSAQIDNIRRIFAVEPNLEFAVLIGSRATNTHTPDSDWDFALQWRKDMDWLTQLSCTETLRHDLAGALQLPETAIDLVDAPRASLAMRAEIAENGIILMGEDGLPCQRFLRRTWRELEEYYWEEIYAYRSVHAETRRIAAQQGALLDEARSRLLASQPLSPLEQNGVLHGFQGLIGNAIGKAKQLLKTRGEEVPISAYDAFASLARIGCINQEKLPEWHGIVGLRNRIVHDYMNVDIDTGLTLVQQGRHTFLIDFLIAPLNDEST